MKKVSIIKNGQVAYACEGTQEDIDKWFNKHSKKFGSPGGYRKEPTVIQPLVLGANGETLQEEIIEERNVWYEPDYERVEEDLTPAIQAQEEKRIKKLAVKQKLKGMDDQAWKNINTIAEVKVLLREIMDILED